ncbi:MAG: hypothetical protein ABL934_07950, partial [Lysobacteraceae bacterium]
MTTQEPITPELRAKIDELPEGSVKKRVLRALTGPGNRTGSNEEIFANIMESVTEAEAQRALREARLYKWRDDEVVAFIDYFREHQPQAYADYLYQERNGRQIDADLAWCMRRLGEQWLPGLDWDDYDELFGMVRDYADTHLV